MNGYLGTSTASHNDEQHPTTSPIVSEAYTDAEGRQTNVDIPSTTSRTDPSFFYPKEKSCSSLKWGTGNASKSKPLPCLGNERIAASKDCVLVKISAESVTSEGSQKENTNVPLAVQLREIRGPIQDADSDESSLSKNNSGVTLRHSRTIAQQVRADIAAGAMSAPTAFKNTAVLNVVTSSTLVDDLPCDMIADDDDVGDKLFKSSSDLQNVPRQTNNDLMSTMQQSFASSTLAGVIGVGGSSDTQRTQRLTAHVKTRTAKNNKTTQRTGFVSNSFHSLWVVAIMMLLMVSETVVEALCAPSNKAELKLVVNFCLSESSDGLCQSFATASDYDGCNNGGVNGVIGDWDVSKVIVMNAVFSSRIGFNADISKWDTKSATEMEYSTCLLCPLLLLLYNMFEN